MSDILGRAFAPAKINHGLAVLRKRADGYHDIVTEMYAISLFDRISMTGGGSGRVHSNFEALALDTNIMSVAAEQLASQTGNALDVDFTLAKRIPIAAGLGGGSSDAGAVLRLLCSLWGLNVDDPRVRAVAEATGSDVPFFLRGGRAMVEGRGERLTHLPARTTRWFLLIVPVLEIGAKTPSMFGALRPSDFSSMEVAANWELGTPRENVFCRPLYERYPQLLEILAAVRAHTDRPVNLSGAGPAHYVSTRDVGEASRLLRSMAGDEMLAGCRIHLAKAIAGPGPLDSSRNGGQ